MIKLKKRKRKNKDTPSIAARRLLSDSFRPQVESILVRHLGNTSEFFIKFSKSLSSNKKARRSRKYINSKFENCTNELLILFEEWRRLT